MAGKFAKRKSAIQLFFEETETCQLYLSLPGRGRLDLREVNNCNDSFVDRKSSVFLTDSCDKRGRRLVNVSLIDKNGKEKK